jgi:hypothetical protein
MTSPAGQLDSGGAPANPNTTALPHLSFSLFFNSITPFTCGLHLYFSLIFNSLLLRVVCSMILDP